jgi:hypothetical protein
MKKLATMVLKQPPARTSANGTVSWALAELKQLGRTPDSVLARRSGRTIQEVVAMRESRGLGLVTGPRPWAAREIKLLGTMPDHELGRRLRASCWAPCPTGRSPGVWAGRLLLCTSGGPHWVSGLVTRARLERPRNPAAGHSARRRTGPGVATQRALGGKETPELAGALPRPALPEMDSGRTQTPWHATR